ncbi:MAG: 3'-5' exonuclease [Clostridia bacterium]
MAKLQRFSYRTRPAHLLTRLELKRQGLVPGEKAVGFFGGTPCWSTLLFDSTKALSKAMNAATVAAMQAHVCVACGAAAVRGRNLCRGGLCNACYAKARDARQFPGHEALRVKAAGFSLKRKRRTREEVVDLCQTLLNGPTLFLDTEATGARGVSEIIEIGLVDTEGRVAFHSLVHAHHPCNPVAYSMHHITEAELALAPDFATVWPQVKALLLTHTVVIFDAPSDLSFLAQTLSANGMSDPDLNGLNICCAMRLYRDFLQTVDCIGLQRACQQQGMETVQQHRVIGDCLMTLGLVQKMADAQAMAATSAG